MPSLRKRNRSGKRTQWDIRYWKDGKQLSYNIGETDRRTAEKIYHEFCRRLSEGKLDGTIITVDEPDNSSSVGPHLSDLAVQTRVFAESNKSPKTLEREQEALKRIILGLGDIPISDLTPILIEEYKAARLKKVSPSTLNIEIRMLNTALNQAVELGWLKNCPAARFKQIKLPESEPPEWLDGEQIARFAEINDEEFRRFLVLILNTGCRRNEALGVCWEDIDLHKRQIVIRGQVGKMGKRRTIPINDDLFAMLSAWSCQRTGRLFPQYSPNQVSMKFRRWANQIGLPKGISLHSLRATFACHLIKNKVDIYTVSKLLGHSSVKVTEKHYLALDPDHVRCAVNQLNFSATSPPLHVGRQPDKENDEGS